MSLRVFRNTDEVLRKNVGKGGETTVGRVPVLYRSWVFRGTVQKVGNEDLYK